LGTAGLQYLRGNPSTVSDFGKHVSCFGDTVAYTKISFHWCTQLFNWYTRRTSTRIPYHQPITYTLD